MLYVSNNLNELSTMSNIATSASWSPLLSKWGANISTAITTKL